MKEVLGSSPFFFAGWALVLKSMVDLNMKLPDLALVLSKIYGDCFGWKMVTSIHLTHWCKEHQHYFRFYFWMWNYFCFWIWFLMLRVLWDSIRYFHMGVILETLLNWCSCDHEGHYNWNKNFIIGECASPCLVVMSNTLSGRLIRCDVPLMWCTLR